MDPLDYIDPDEGREFVREAFFTEGEPCENCGKPCLEDRVYVPGFDFMGCQDCAEEARVVIFAEENCQTLHDAVIRSTTAQQVAKAMREHEATCPSCNPALRTVAMPARKEAGTAEPGEFKEAA